MHPGILPALTKRLRQGHLAVSWPHLDAEQVADGDCRSECTPHDEVGGGRRCRDELARGVAYHDGVADSDRCAGLRLADAADAYAQVLPRGHRWRLAADAYRLVARHAGQDHITRGAGAQVMLDRAAVADAARCVQDRRAVGRRVAERADVHARDVRLEFGIFLECHCLVTPPLAAFISAASPPPPHTISHCRLRVATAPYSRCCARPS